MTHQPPIALLTDFGYTDPYVGIMKGTIASLDPTLTVIDLTHGIPPQDIAAARFSLMCAYPYFPRGTVHVVVVDPGVGGQRRAIAIQLPTAVLVGPDNGVLSGVLTQVPPEQWPQVKAVQLTNATYWRSPHPSTTFHGRDIFAPVGAFLATGVPITDLGERVELPSLVHLPQPPLVYQGDRLSGYIQHIDQFGNLITNVPAHALPEDIRANADWSVQAGERLIPGCHTYGDRAEGELAALVGSHGWVEIAVNGGSARVTLALERGGSISVILRR
ncbi:MAG: SAM-dependent chlorinase/fluorinase [Synechococcales bacterium]|nr:SAM-dependent chlorinase/fluorinase [Synechococcales bacterium]